jgi:hypothetical protein
MQHIVCQERATFLADVDKQTIASALTTHSFNDNLQTMLRAGGDLDVKINVDSMAGKPLYLSTAHSSFPSLDFFLWIKK